jgi:N-dimethylarginine dimethylaminohydrolase
MQLNIRNEFSTLEQVIVGIADNSGGRPHLEETYDPKTREYVRKGVYPYDEDMHEEMEYFVKVLERHNVEVLRPRNINNLNQIFTRDLCFVLDDKLIIPEIIREREDEQEGINHIIQKLSKDQIHDSPEGIRIEGGDVVLDDRFVFVGYSNEEDFYTYKTSRTNEAGLRSPCSARSTPLSTMKSPRDGWRSAWK